MVFLSYATADRDVAEEVHFALATAGLEVFFDRESLTPGGEYHTRIHQELNRSSLLVFLISPDSVAKGSYCLSELKFAKEKWPSPKGVVLPVIVRETDFKAIPAYLKAVTVETPEGDLAAEVLALVQKHAELNQASEKKAAGTFAGVPPAPSVIVGLPQYLHNMPVLMPDGQRQPGMTFSLPETAHNAIGMQLQFVIHFGLWGGGALVANNPVWRDPGGFVAAWTGPRPSPIARAVEPYTETQLAIPYIALNLPPTGGMMVYSLGFPVDVFLNGSPVARSAAVPFQVRW